MKKISFLMIMSALLFSGCVFAPQKMEVTVHVKEKDYTVNDAQPRVKVDMEIRNGLDKNLYYSSQCYYPWFNIYTLGEGGEWSLQPKEECPLGIAPVPDVPHIVKPGKSSPEQVFLFKEGVHKIEFFYYVNEEDYKNRTNVQRIFSNQFSVAKIKAVLRLIVESCRKEDDPTNNRLASCLYSSAQSVAGKDLDLALDLCREVERMKDNTFSCYTAVAYMARVAGFEEKIDYVCNQYKDPVRIENCLHDAR